MNKAHTMEPNEHASILNWVITGVITIIGSLSAAIGILFKINETRNSREICELKEGLKECAKDREECETDRLRLTAQLNSVEGRVSYLEDKLSTKTPKSDNHN